MRVAIYMWVGAAVIVLTSAATYIAVAVAFLFWPMQSIAALAALVGALITGQAYLNRRFARQEASAPTAVAGGRIQDETLIAVLGADLYAELLALDSTPGTTGQQ